jgi:hypothetical protein
MASVREPTQLIDGVGRYSLLLLVLFFACGALWMDWLSTGTPSKPAQHWQARIGATVPTSSGETVELKINLETTLPTTAFVDEAFGVGVVRWALSMGSTRRFGNGYIHEVGHEVMFAVGREQALSFAASSAESVVEFWFG